MWVAAKLGSELYNTRPAFLQLSFTHGYRMVTASDLKASLPVGQTGKEKNGIFIKKLKQN